MQDESVNVGELSQTQRERLAYIDFRLYFFGKVGRADLMDRFGLGSAGATRDFALYKEIAPGNLELDNVSKLYVILDEFRPVFEHIPERVLTALSKGFGDGSEPIEGSLIPCAGPTTLSRPKMEILAPITRAIYSSKGVKIKYFSGASGASEKEIFPFAIAFDGLRWHTRAFDRTKQRFGDYVLTRMSDVRSSQELTPLKNELPPNDIQWNRIVELDLIPHPDRESPELVIQDYDMKDKVLRIELRAAMVGYFLQQYHVDCSPDHSIKDKAFRLWLRDPLALYGVQSAMFAPGYVQPGNN